jgi:hypothetical protein
MVGGELSVSYLTIAVGIMVLTIISLVAVFIIEDRKLDKKIKKMASEFKIKKEKEKIAEVRLTNSLKQLCKQLGIDLSYQDELGDAAGIILYNRLNGRLLVDNSRIQILNKYIDQPYVLAHELGHYMAIKQRQDDSEEGADAEALCLCKSILTQEEQDLMEIGLSCHFKTI